MRRDWFVMIRITQRLMIEMATNNSSKRESERGLVLCITEYNLGLPTGLGCSGTRHNLSSIIWTYPLD